MQFLFINFVIALWVTAVTTFLLGVFVLVKNRQNIINKTFALYSFSITWWSFSEIWGIACDKKLTALIWTRIEQVGVFFIPTFFVHFVISLLGIKNKKWVIRAAYALSAIFAILSSTALMIADSVPRPSIAYVKHFGTPGFLYHFAVVFFIILCTYGLFYLCTVYMKSSAAKRNQLKYLFLSSLFGYIGGGANFLLVYGINIPFINPFGTYALPVYIAVVTYAILRHRLMDINVAITIAGIFAIVYTLVLGLPFLAIKWFEPILKPILGGGNWWLPIVIFGMVLASAGPFIYMSFQRRATAYLLREERRAHDLLIKASMGLANIRELKVLLKTIVSFIVKTLHITNAAIYLLDKEEQIYKLESVRFKSIFGGPQAIDEKNPIVELLKKNDRPIVLDELRFRQDLPEGEKIALLMQDMSAAVIIPSFTDEILLGFMVLGDKKFGRMYTENDLGVLSVLANQAALAIENAIFYEEQGKTLAQQFQEHRLRSLGKMGSGIGHQINNRFQAIAMTAGSSQMLDVEELKKANLSDEQKKLVEGIAKSLNDIVQECMRGGNIARSLTQFSRTQEDFKPVSLRDILEGTISLLSCKFNIEEINLSLNYPQDGPPLFGNLALLQDIFFNHLDNARDACLTKKEEIDKGIIKTDASYAPKVNVNAYPKDGYWHIEIKDNGIGMTEEQLDQAFIPFFTTKATSSKGTGLGLSIIKKIIDAHKGTIAVSSKYGEGTAFSITLPVTSSA